MDQNTPSTATGKTTAAVDPAANRDGYMPAINGSMFPEHPAGEAVLPSPGDTATSDPTADAVAEAKARVVDAITTADELFGGTATLEHIAAWGDARGSSRVAVLAQVLMRTTLAIPPHVVIPAHTGGDRVGLSLLLAVAGVTTGGKGRAEAVGRDAVALRSYGRVTRVEPVSPSTGEGLVSVFAETQRDPLTRRTRTLIHTSAALLSFKDVESFGALVSRSGATLSGTLLSLYMGDPLGFFTRERERRVTLPAHTVVAGLSAGVQPAKGSVLLNPDMASSGMPHRFLWTPVRNGRRTQRGAPPVSITVDVPDFGITTDPFGVDFVFLPGEGVDVSDLVELDVAASVADEIHAADQEKDLDVFGAAPAGVDPLYGHTALTRLKVAAALGALHGETGVTAAWWEPAGRVMDVSTAVCNAVAVASGAAEVVAQQQAGELLGHRYAAADAVRDDVRVREVADRLYARVRDDWHTVNSTAIIGERKHPFIAAAWQLLIDTGKVEAVEHEFQPGRTTFRYRRTPAPH
jgi:hypothetical protein